MRLKREPNTRRMKLNQFFTKPVIEKPQATVFQLSNETREAELENIIRELEAQLARLVDQGEENTFKKPFSGGIIPIFPAIGSTIIAAIS